MQTSTLNQNLLGQQLWFYTKRNEKMSKLICYNWFKSMVRSLGLWPQIKHIQKIGRVILNKAFVNQTEFACVHRLLLYRRSPIVLNIFNKIVPGDARTHNLGMTWCRLLSYKYHAPTDCATGAQRKYNKNLQITT